MTTGGSRQGPFIFFSILKPVHLKKIKRGGVERVGVDGKILKPILFTFDFFFYFLFLIIFIFFIFVFNFNFYYIKINISYK